MKHGLNTEKNFVTFFLLFNLCFVRVTNDSNLHALRKFFCVVFVSSICHSGCGLARRLVLSHGFPEGEKHRSPGQTKASFTSLRAARGWLSRTTSAEQNVLPAVVLWPRPKFLAG